MRLQHLWVSVFTCALIWSAVEPKDYYTWILEVIPAIVGTIILAVTYNTFRLTSLLYILILLHCVILMIGGHYTYAEVPLFDLIKELFNLERNNYDKVGHFAQGLTPALIARELIIRKEIIIGYFWQNLFVVCFALAFSAFYELIEWWVAIVSGEGAEAFLGTQGYVWDTQSDMFMALIGSITGLIVFSRMHDKQLSTIRI